METMLILIYVRYLRWTQDCVYEILYTERNQEMTEGWSCFIRTDVIQNEWKWGWRVWKIAWIYFVRDPQRREPLAAIQQKSYSATSSQWGTALKTLNLRRRSCITARLHTDTSADGLIHLIWACACERSRLFGNVLWWVFYYLNDHWTPENQWCSVSSHKHTLTILQPMKKTEIWLRNT